MLRPLCVLSRMVAQCYGGSELWGLRAGHWLSRRLCEECVVYLPLQPLSPMPQTRPKGQSGVGRGPVQLGGAGHPEPRLGAALALSTPWNHVTQDKVLKVRGGKGSSSGASGVSTEKERKSFCISLKV